MSEQVPRIEGTKFSGIACDLTSLASLPADVASKAAIVTEAGLQFNALTGESLADLAPFSSLETLLLDNNEIATLRFLPPLPHLHTLWLNNNELATLDDVVLPLSKQCPRLSYLSLLRNPCCPNELMGKGEAEYRRYRLYVKYRLPTLQYLDAAPFTADEAKEARDKGQFMATATVSKKADDAAAAGGSEALGALASKSPAGSSSRKLGDGAEKDGAAAAAGGSGNLLEEPDYFKAIEERERAKHTQPYFTQQKHFYSGKASEGNRFIRDDVL